MKHNYFKKFANLPFNEKLLFFEALFTQYAIWFLLKIIPFKRIPRLFPNPRKPVENADGLVLEQIRLATGYANTLSFWKNKCLVQSLAARWMLSRRGISSRLTMGVMHNDLKKVVAHAWLTAGDTEIVSKTGDYRELYSF